jgi:hypothetical protein
MNFFEREIAKYERRVKRINENPDPNLLASNKLLYVMLLDHQSVSWHGGRRGNPSPYMTAFKPSGRSERWVSTAKGWSQYN